MLNLNVNKENFKSEVLESNKPVLLDFFASWCGPCKMLSPIIDEIAEEREDVKVVKLDIDEHPELAAQFGVMSVPSLFVIKGGEIANKALGVRPKQQILGLL
ncbi:MAG: thioredoxin [Firmicutes bacterium]|nr:thioredoxin [Bacillota bacterium]MBR4020763.1 thioredoxin [Bacillota bacterium]